VLECGSLHLFLRGNQFEPVPKQRAAPHSKKPARDVIPFAHLLSNQLTALGQARTMAKP